MIAGTQLNLDFLPQWKELKDVRKSNQKKKIEEITPLKDNITFVPQQWILCHKILKDNKYTQICTNDIDLIVNKFIQKLKLNNSEINSIKKFIETSKTKLTKALRIPHTNWVIITNNANYKECRKDPKYTWHFNYLELDSKTKKKFITDSYLLTDNFNYTLGLVNGFNKGKAIKGSTYRDEISKRNPSIKGDWVITPLKH